jgi:hippurate hydrolase
LIYLFLAMFNSVAEADQTQSLAQSIEADYDSNLEGLFIHFHSNPELSFREFKTAERLAVELRALGYEVTEKVGETGVVAVFENGDGPTVLLRADMDGLPLEENSGLPYASKQRQVDYKGVEQPVMHACGHDVHITSLIGTARQLMERKTDWSGTLVLVCQPAEEIISGARAMLMDGLYSRFPKPDYAVGFHVASLNPTGSILIDDGAVTSSSDTVDIIVKGIGTHGAAPHKGIDPVLVASQIVVSLQSIVSRTIPPRRHGVITVGSIHGGRKRNIIGERVDLQLTVRSDDPETRQLLLDGIDRVAKGVALSLGVPESLLPEVKRSETEQVSPMVNDAQSVARLRNAFSDHFGADVFYEREREVMGAEDFSCFSEPGLEVKGVFFIVGGSVTENLDDAPPHHSPIFKIDPKPAITTGVEAMTVAALTFLETRQ